MNNIKKLAVLVLTVVFAFTLAACDTEDDSTLVVGLECDYAPFNWTTNDDSAQQVDGQAFYCDGYDVTIAEIIAEELGRELVIRQVDWDGLPIALQAGNIDVIIAGMSPTEERRTTMLFSDAYFVSEQVLVVRRDSLYADASTLSDFSGANVIAQQGTLQDNLIDQIPSVNHQAPLGTYASLVEQVRSTASDAFIAELPVAMSIIANNSELIMVRLTDGFELDENDISVSVAMRLGEDALLAEINAIIASIDSETREAYMQEALNKSEE